MKKAFFTLAAALLVLSGCQNDEVLESAVKAQQKAVLTATIPGKTTKVSYEEVLPEEEEIENTSLKAAWDANDAISLIALDSDYKVIDVYNYIYEGEGCETSGAFTGEMITGASHVVAIYPALESIIGGPAEDGWGNAIIEPFPKGVSAFNFRCDNTIVQNIEVLSDYTLMSGDVSIDDSGEMETTLEQEIAVIKLYDYETSEKPNRYVLYDTDKFDFTEGEEPEHNTYAVFTFEDRSLDTSETAVDIEIYPDEFTFEGQPYLVIPPMSSEKALGFNTYYPESATDEFTLYQSELKAGFFYLLD